MFETEKSPGCDTGAKNNHHTKFNGSKHSAQDFEEQFREFCRENGFDLPPKLEADGKVQRFGPNDVCAYVLHLDGVPSGWIQDWRQDATRYEWNANGRKLNHEERKRADAEIKAAKAKRDADKAERHAKASATAERLWNEATPGREDHPYLVRKRVKPHGLREYQGALDVYGGRVGRYLVVPIWHDGKLVGLQFIDADGKKRFLPGTPKHYYVIGEIEHADRVCIAEGFATAATIYEATGIACAVAFDCRQPSRGREGAQALSFWCQVHRLRGRRLAA